MEDNKKEPGGERPETLDGIVVDILDRAVVADRHGARETSNESVAALLRDIANRIKAIIARDTVRLSDGSSPIVESAKQRAHFAKLDAEYAGYKNMAAMREALEKARLFAGCSIQDIVIVGMGCIDRDKLCAEIDAALAAPPRNCDVGTAVEQEKRFRKICRSANGAVCLGCPVVALEDCGIVWAQLPYEAEEGAE